MNRTQFRPCTIKTVIIGLCSAAFIFGCGKETRKVVPVSGKITFAGKPMPNIHVSFQPIRGGEGSTQPGSGSTGVTDAQGCFTLRTIDPVETGAVTGEHAVRLSRNEENEVIKSDLSPPRNSLLPQKCRDGSIHFTVPAEGTSAADFDLQAVLSGK